MPKVIVFSGHGRWDLGGNSFVQMPARTTMKFFTLNAKLLSDAFGGKIDRGQIDGVEPDQVAGPFQSVPDMTLFPPTGLHIQSPPPSWHVLNLPCPIPIDDRNLQIRIKPQYGGGGSLKVLLELLDDALRVSQENILLWAACRDVKLKEVGGEQLGVNVVGR